MSYGGQSNAPWQRNVMQGHQQSGGFHQSSPMYMQNAPQNNMAAFGHSGMQGGGSSNMFPGGSGGGSSVSYPQPRSGLNPVAFQQGGGNQSQYNSVGTVTKINNDCGLVNDEVFFYRNVCKGPEPILGDRVIFEASYSNNGQFKWNATRIQLLQPPQSLMGSNKSSYNAVAPPNEYQRGQIRRNSPKRSPVRGGHDRDRERLHRSREREEVERKRRREDTDRSRDRGAATNNRAAVEPRGGHAARNDKDRERVENKKKEREVTDRERERELARALETQRAANLKDRRARNRKRYMVKIPKSLLTIKTADFQDLRYRYTALYIPSDFFLANIKWSDTFTPDNQFSLRRPCHFHIMHEMVESPFEENPDLLEPADASYLYSAKVMLLSLPPIAEIYKKCFENDDNDDHSVHPSRLINFLVGVKGGVGSMAIGGPWSPSLDGENPDKDPSVLIRTAIRTCKALTGIDLSNCTQWYRFVELYYHRTEYKNMEKDGPPRVETVVIYLPDVHSCMPSIEEWQKQTQVYRNAADGVIARRSALVAAAAENSNENNDNLNDAEMADSSTIAADTAGEEKTTDNGTTSSANNEDGDDQNNEEQDEKMDDSTASADISGATDDAEIECDEDGEDADDETIAIDENDEPAPEPTHYSLLDLKTMKVQEIRDELLARNLPDKGVRNVIMARLAKALNTEKSEEIRNRNRNKYKKPLNKKDDEKMEVDAENSKATGKKTGDENKKKKEGSEIKVNGNDKTSKSPAGKKSVSKAKEDNVDWADVIDFDINDIVILDEYDLNKNSEETNLKEMSEKEKARLIRCHTLPTSPYIIVHPNRQAKGGKFDCAVKSLSVLLDYHPDDNKERFFEVSLFAELFNDMLMRDFGFNIYKEIYLYKEPANNNDIKEVTESDHKIEKSEDSKEKEKEDEKDKSSKKDKTEKEKRPDDLQSNKSESRKRKLSTSTSTANGKDHELAVSDKKTVVIKPQLLLSFVYFDTTHCDYIFEKDLEDLFAVLGLNLARSQIKNVLGMCKLTKSEIVKYRELTDREESSDSIPSIEEVDDLSTDELERIAAGNNQYESVFGRTTANNQISAIGDGENEEGLTNFNGTVVHVGKLLNQINRTEKNYSDLEKIYNDLLKQHTDLQKDHTKSSTKIKDLNTEIKSVSRKLIEANQDYYSLNRKFRDQNATLSYIYTRVSPYFIREKDKENKERDAKSEGPRDKDKENKEKEKEKSKDKESEKDKDKTKEDKEKEVKKEDNKNKEDDKGDKNEKEKVKNEKEKVRDDKEKVKVEKVKDEKEKVKDDKEKEKEKIKIEKEEKVKDDKDKEKEKVQPKVEKEKEKEKVQSKPDKEKEKVQPKADKEKVQPKPDKEKPKDNKQNEKAKEAKEKLPAKDDKVKPTPQKNVSGIQKPNTPGAKKLSDSRPAGKIIKKPDNVAAKK